MIAIRELTQQPISIVDVRLQCLLEGQKQLLRHPHVMTIAFEFSGALALTDDMSFAFGHVQSA